MRGLPLQLTIPQPEPEIVPEPISEPEPQIIVIPIYMPEPTTPEPAAEPATPAVDSQQEKKSEVPVKKTTLEIIGPIKGKGLGRKYIASDKVVDESNYIELGIIVRNAEDKILTDVTCVITATDATQNKTINSTGNVTPIYKNGIKKVVHYYPFSYEFKTPGKHVITFVCDGITKEITLEVEKSIDAIDTAQ